MDETQPQTAAQQETNELAWTASEFVITSRSLFWNAIFVGLILAVCCVITVVAKDYFAGFAILLAGVLYKIMTAKKPRNLEYKIDELGFFIDKKYYEFAQFKSFMIVTAAGVVGLEFLPIKKFSTEVMFFTPPELTEQIVKLVGQHVPHDQTRINKIDELVNRFKI